MGTGYSGISSMISIFESNVNITTLSSVLVPYQGQSTSIALPTFSKAFMYLITWYYYYGIILHPVSPDLLNIEASIGMTSSYPSGSNASNVYYLKFWLSTSTTLNLRFDANQTTNGYSITIAFFYWD